MYRSDLLAERRRVCNTPLPVRLNGEIGSPAELPATTTIAFCEVLGAMYYRSGIDDFLNAARTLASRWWGGVLNRGENYNLDKVGGTFAGPPRSQSVTGIILWYFDQGTNIWPGMANMEAYDTWLGISFPSRYSWNVQAGNLRENAYMLHFFALWALYDTDKTRQASMKGNIHTMLNRLWAPAELDGTWETTDKTGTYIFTSGGDIPGSITVTDGSRNVTLNGGGTWSPAHFNNGNTSPATPWGLWVWFVDDPANGNNIGSGKMARQSSDIGDSGFYHVVATTQSDFTTPCTANCKHGVLNIPYGSAGGSFRACPTGCNKGASIGVIVGFGTEPFMHGLFIGGLATWVYQVVSAPGYSYPHDMTSIKKMVVIARVLRIILSIRAARVCLGQQ